MQRLMHFKSLWVYRFVFARQSFCPRSLCREKLNFTVYVVVHLGFLFPETFTQSRVMLPCVNVYYIYHEILFRA